MRYIFLTSFALTALATAAFAQGGGMGLMRADANHDGAVSRAEAEADAGARFDAMDLDKDGFLSADEMKGPGARLLERAGGKISRADYVTRADRRFDRLDTNHDGVLTQDELKAGMERIREGLGRSRPVDAAVPPPPPAPPLSPKPGQ